MIFDHPLTGKQRRRSRRNYNLFSLVNGASYACLGETVVVLYAIRLQAPNIVAAAIGAMLYLGFLLLPLGMFRMGRVGAARSQADFWYGRNLAALLAASGAAVLPFSPALSWTVLLLGCFLFYGFRAAGVVMAVPLIGEITTGRDRAKLLGSSSALFHVSGLLSLLAISGLLGWRDSLGMLAGIIVAGAVSGIAAASFLRNIDETSALRRSARKPLLPQLNMVLRNPVLRRQAAAGFVFNLAGIMLIPISVTALKRGYGVDDRQAVLFAAAQFVASIAGSGMIAPVIARIGARKLALLAYGMIFPVCLFWLAIPGSAGNHAAVFSVPFVLIGIFGVFYNNALHHCFLRSVPPELQAAGSMALHVVTGAAAGIAGMLLAGMLLKTAEAWQGPGIAMFRSYFAMAGVLFSAGIFLILRLDVPPAEPQT